MLTQQTNRLICIVCNVKPFIDSCRVEAWPVHHSWYVFIVFFFFLCFCFVMTFHPWLTQLTPVAFLLSNRKKKKNGGAVKMFSSAAAAAWATSCKYPHWKHTLSVSPCSFRANQNNPTYTLLLGILHSRTVCVFSQSLASLSPQKHPVIPSCLWIHCWRMLRAQWPLWARVWAWTESGL